MVECPFASEGICLRGLAGKAGICPSVILLSHGTRQNTSIIFAECRKY